VRHVQLLGSGPRRSGLRGVALGLAQLRDRNGKANQVGDQRGCGQRQAVVVHAAGHGQDPSYGAQPVAVTNAARCTAEGHPGGAVVGVGGTTQVPVVSDPSGDVERVGGGPRSVGGLVRFAPDAVPDVFRRRSGLAGRV
jgi:hypothetical protein